MYITHGFLTLCMLQSGQTPRLPNMLKHPFYLYTIDIYTVALYIYIYIYNVCT